MNTHIISLPTKGARLFLVFFCLVHFLWSQPINPNLFYRLVAKHNGYVLDVENASRDNQADVIARPWNGGANQQWKLEAMGDGSYRLIARHSGKVLDVNDYQTNQANVVQHEWHGGNNQRFVFEPIGDGYFKVVAKFSGKVLDVNMDDRANVVQHDWHTGDNQRWKLESVSGSGGNNEQTTGSIDLTGLWQDDQGAKYQIRQTGNQIWWYMDKTPEVANVFKGNLSGNALTGEWADVPGGQLLHAGSLQLKVVNNNRLEKVSSSFHYGGTLWTRR